MARRKTRTLTELELEIMHVVWREGEATVEVIRRALEKSSKPLALPSVRTMLGILQDKNYVTRRPVGRGYAYRAVVSQDQAQKSIVKDVVDRAFEGSALDLVTALIGGKMVSKKDMDRVKQLIGEHETIDRQKKREARK
ncbi:unnamed protein product [marine sediment metagenome]|uniref:CopY family transcriptional regulator n=1 Tax=marine sediment metagenome TaxID=412755 RepID=X0X1F3_9ZZZZ